MHPALPLLIVISAPSGGGKTTLCDQLLASHPDVTRVVTCTTRQPRTGELPGVHYHFLSRAAFLNKIVGGEFLEHASVYENLYGTLKADVLAKLESGRHVLLNIDVQGAEAIRKTALANPAFAARLVTVFLTPPSLADLEQRLVRRQADSAEGRALRLKQAAAEVSEWHRFDYLIVSTTIAEDLRRMEVVLEAELMRQPRAQPPAY